ncbi:Hpt domain-containing protein [Eubacteriales bacterium OttesenSCG-928-K08]|nr:Hpt domain-containing protein [Eubacteriales bacterium OttesenSCG-928-K08]
MSELGQQERGQYMDVGGALARVRNNVKLYNRMLQMFQQSAEFDAFDQAIAAEDYARAADVIHGIKGMTGNLSLTLVYELSSALMNQLRNGAYEPETLEQYRDALEKTRAYVEEYLAE